MIFIGVREDNKTPLTTTRGFATLPFWSADGTRLIYGYQPPGQMDDVYIKDLRTGKVSPVTESPAYEDPLSWSHNGSSMLVYTKDEKGEAALSAWSFESHTFTRFSGSPAWAPSFFSPDDRYVALTSAESGRAEVSGASPDLVAHDRGWPCAKLRTDGREILVATLSGHIVAYPVSTEGGFSAGQSTVIVRDVGIAAQFSTATPDHSKILIRVSPDAARDKGEIQLVFGWADAWRQGKLMGNR